MFCIYVGADLIAGIGSLQIPFRGVPQNPEVVFIDSPPLPPMCGPLPPADTVTATAVNLGSSFRPRWVLQLTWDVQFGSRVCAWSCEI